VILLQEQEPAQGATPRPEFPYLPGHRLVDAVRWFCLLGCGWHHDEWPVQLILRAVES
jgi:hypothetical protein